MLPDGQELCDAVLPTVTDDNNRRDQWRDGRSACDGRPGPTELYLCGRLVSLRVGRRARPGLLPISVYLRDCKLYACLGECDGRDSEAVPVERWDQGWIEGGHGYCDWDDYVFDTVKGFGH